MSVVLETKNIIKDFNAGERLTRVLHGIDINVRAGELTMLMGPSGCGKTTLLSIITCILSPTEGKLTICGTPMMTLSDAEKVLFRREKIGFIFQNFNLLPALTSAENAALPLIVAGIRFNEALDIARNILAQLEMHLHTEKLPYQLSGGQQQRVAFARAIIHRPKILVCDEPTSALDAHNGQKVMEKLESIAAQLDTAVIVVTHDSRIVHFANRIFYMSDGKIDKEDVIK